MNKTIKISEKELRSLIKETIHRMIFESHGVDMTHVDYVSYDKSPIDNDKYLSFKDKDEWEFSVTCYDLNGNIIYDEYYLSYEEMENAVGETIAQKILQTDRLKGVIYNDQSTTIIDKNDNDEVIAVASKYFPIVDYTPNSIGYLLPNGKLLDVGDKGHIAINCVDGMTVGKMISLGNIRVDKDILELELQPTFEQKKSLYKLIGSGDYIYVDICKYMNNGEQYAKNVSSAYFKVNNPKYILNQIDRYFNEGIKLSSINTEGIIKISEKKLQHLISESIEKALLKEFMQPSFSWKEFFRLCNLNYAPSKRIEYCTKYLGEPIGQGVHRTVFDIDDNIVLKVASGYNTDQNEQEINVVLSNPNNPLLPKIYAYDHVGNYKWILTERVIGAKNYDFERILGIPFDFPEIEIPVKRRYKDDVFDEYKAKAPLDSRWADPNKVSEKDYNKEWSDEVSMRGFLEWYTDYMYGWPIDKESYECKEYIKWLKHPWFKNLIKLFKYQVPTEFRIENFGIAMRNGEPTIVVLDIGWGGQ